MWGAHIQHISSTDVKVCSKHHSACGSQHFNSMYLTLRMTARSVPVLQAPFVFEPSLKGQSKVPLPAATSPSAAATSHLAVTPSAPAGTSTPSLSLPSTPMSSKTPSPSAPPSSVGSSEVGHEKPVTTNDDSVSSEQVGEGEESTGAADASFTFEAGSERGESGEDDEDEEGSGSASDDESLEDEADSSEDDDDDDDEDEENDDEDDDDDDDGDDDDENADSDDSEGEPISLCEMLFYYNCVTLDPTGPLRMYHRRHFQVYCRFPLEL